MHRQTALQTAMRVISLILAATALGFAAKPDADYRRLKDVLRAIGHDPECYEIRSSGLHEQLMALPVRGDSCSEEYPLRTCGNQEGTLRAHCWEWMVEEYGELTAYQRQVLEVSWRTYRLTLRSRKYAIERDAELTPQFKKCASNLLERYEEFPQDFRDFLVLQVQEYADHLVLRATLAGPLEKCRNMQVFVQGKEHFQMLAGPDGIPLPPVALPKELGPEPGT